MKNRKYTYQLIVLAFAVNLIIGQSFAQLSGYQGKKFSFGYGSNLGYAVFNKNSEGVSLFGSGQSVDMPIRMFETFNYKHQAQMELVYNSNSIVGLQMSYGLTQFRALKSNDNYDYNNSNYTIGHDIYSKMKIATFGIYIKKFSTKTAPIGRYYSLKLSMLRYKPDFESIELPGGFPKSIKSIFNTYSTSIVFALSVGKSRIYYNHLIVDSNFEFGLPFVMPGFGSSLNLDYSTTNFEKQINTRMNNRLWGNFLLNVNVNVSLLAF
jgi:hypothetical protein